jgi:hydroxymethylpyrimidine pyrophosphatase-like HAD family hydrolase
MVEYICFDLDGTLINEHCQLFPESERVLLEARKTGKKVILLSCNPGLRDISGELGIEAYFDGMIWCNTIKKALHLYIHGIDDEKALMFDDIKEVVAMFPNRGYLVEKGDIGGAWSRYKGQ